MAQQLNSAPRAHCSFFFQAFQSHYFVRRKHRDRSLTWKMCSLIGGSIAGRQLKCPIVLSAVQTLKHWLGDLTTETLQTIADIHTTYYRLFGVSILDVSHGLSFLHYQIGAFREWLRTPKSGGKSSYGIDIPASKWRTVRDNNRLCLMDWSP